MTVMSPWARGAFAPRLAGGRSAGGGQLGELEFKVSVGRGLGF